MATARDDGSGTTVKGHFNALTERYYADVLNTSAASTDRGLLRLVCQLIAECELLWQRVMAVGALSANDSLEDYTTTAVEMVWTPYLIGDLYQRLQGPQGEREKTTTTTTAARGGGGAGGAERFAGEGQLLVGPGSSSSGGGTAPPPELQAYTDSILSSSTALASLTRQEALSRSHAWFKIFFEWMENMELVKEETIETYSVYRADQRTQRIELQRRTSELRKEWTQLEGKVQYLRAKRRRMRELMEESGEVLEEAGGEEEEALRERALARLRWSIYDACHQMQLSARELDMLRAIEPEQRAAISAQYQQTLDAVRRGEVSLGRQTYTILPNGGMVVGTLQHPQPVDADVVARAGGLSSEAMSAIANQQMFRQQVQQDLMVDRNPPTMSLQEFAAREMADVQRQMAEAAEMQRQQKEEDDRLGAEGIEERERQKDSAWADWKDAHPAYGITNKGNYS